MRAVKPSRHLADSGWCGREMGIMALAATSLAHAHSAGDSSSGNGCQVPVHGGIHVKLSALEEEQEKADGEWAVRKRRVAKGDRGDFNPKQP